MARRLFVWSAGLVLAVCGLTIAQNQEKLTPRELFYSARKAAPARTAASTGARPGGERTAPTTPAAPTASAANRLPDESIRTAGISPTPVLSNAGYTPLGLRYSIARGSGGGKFAEVNVDTSFRTGEGIRVTVESNDNAYLYIINQGSTGAWSALFPSPEIDNGNNRVQAHSSIDVPSKGQFTFVDQAGDEHLFIVLSRQMETDLDKLIYSLRQPQATPERAEPSRAQQPGVMMVQASQINNALVEKIRNAVMARDLVFEKVDVDTVDTSARKEKAAYVVNVTGSATGRVVADLTLKHTR